MKDENLYAFIKHYSRFSCVRCWSYMLYSIIYFISGISDSELDALLQDDSKNNGKIRMMRNESTVEPTPKPEVDLAQLSDFDLIAHQSNQ